MKKLIMVVLIAAVSVVSIFAAATQGSASGTVGDNPEAYTVVTLDLTDGGKSYVELWFDKEASTSIPDTPKATVNLGFSDDATSASNSGDPLYACWNIVSGDSIDVELYLTGPLTANGKEIEWTATWKKDSSANVTISSNEVTGDSLEDSDVLKSYTDATGNTLKKTDSKQITISTTTIDYTDIVPGTYTAKLYLRCKTN